MLSPPPRHYCHWIFVVCCDLSPLFALNDIGNILWNSLIWWSPFLTASLGFIWASESSFEETQVGWWASPKAASSWLGKKISRFLFVHLDLLPSYQYAFSIIYVQDKVILAINSAAAAKIFFERHVAPGRSFAQFSILCMYSLQDSNPASQLHSSSIPLWCAIFDDLCCVFSGLLPSCGK